MSQYYQMSASDLEQYNRDGFLIVRKLFSDEEMDLLYKTAKEDQAIKENARANLDTQGGSSKLTLWNHPTDDIYGMIARSHRVVDTMEKIIGGEVYHWHSKMMLKEPFVGGAWEWHQDYGYWYNHNACLYPDMASCFISIDKARKENGCLQVIKGSHKMGRIDHGKVAGQVGADMERVNEALKRLELVYVETEPGDATFFHGNLLHRSDQNRSAMPRWTLICCYNAATNNPYKASGHPFYTPLSKVPDEAVLEAGKKGSQIARQFKEKAVAAV